MQPLVPGRGVLGARPARLMLSRRGPSTVKVAGISRLVILPHFSAFRVGCAFRSWEIRVLREVLFRGQSELDRPRGRVHDRAAPATGNSQPANGTRPANSCGPAHTERVVGAR